MAFGIPDINVDQVVSNKLGSLGLNRVNSTLRNVGVQANRFNSLFDQIRDGLSNPTKYLDSYVQSLASAVGISPFARDLGPAAITRVDPVMNYLWSARIVGGSSPSNPMHKYIDQIQTPALSFDTQSVYRRGKKQHYAGAFSADNLTIHLYSGIDGTSFDYAALWVRSVMGYQGYFSPPSQYKRDVLLDILDPNNRVVIQFAFRGCWPTNWNGYTFDSGAGQVVMTELTLSVDNLSFDLDELPTISSLTQDRNNDGSNADQLANKAFSGKGLGGGSGGSMPFVSGTLAKLGSTFKGVESTFKGIFG